MPSKKAKPVTARRPRGRQLPPQAVIFVIVALVVGISLLAVVGYRNQETKKQSEAAAALAADKATFAQIESDMAATYQAIIAAAGNPDEESYDKGCGRVNLKFAEGSITCSVVYTFAYAETNVTTADNRVVKLSNSRKEGVVSNFTTTNYATFRTTNEGSQTIRLELNHDNPSSCYIRISYGDPANYEGYKIINADKFSLYSFICENVVEQPVYTLAE